MMFYLVFFSLVFAVARFTIPTHPLSVAGAYTAFAHLFLGALIGAWATTRNWNYLGLVIALSAVEVFAFFYLRS